MPAPTDLLYTLRDIDQLQPAWSNLFFRQVITNNAAASITSQPQGPADDKLWFVTGLYARLTPQAAVISESIRFNLSAAAGGVLATVAGDRSDPTNWGAGASFIRFFPVDVVVVGGAHVLRAVFGFSAGNVANDMAWSFHGYEVPKGNVQLK